MAAFNVSRGKRRRRSVDGRRILDSVAGTNRKEGEFPASVIASEIALAKSAVGGKRTRWQRSASGAKFQNRNSFAMIGKQA